MGYLGLALNWALVIVFSCVYLSITTTRHLHSYQLTYSDQFRLSAACKSTCFIVTLQKVLDLACSSHVHAIFCNIKSKSDEIHENMYKTKVWVQSLTDSGVELAYGPCLHTWGGLDEDARGDIGSRVICRFYWLLKTLIVDLVYRRVSLTKSLSSNLR